MPTNAITMGVGTILEARKLLLIANGKQKASAVAMAVEGPLTSMVTASALQLHEDATFIIDREAAGGLQRLDYYEWIQRKMPKSS
jgi:glucosamine-6-phosphate deaminase